MSQEGSGMGVAENKAQPFKKCPCCSFVWDNENDFLSDSNIEIMGDPVFFEKTKKNFFLFNHKICQSSLTVQPLGFTSLREDLKEVLSWAERPAYCLYPESMEGCSPRCDCSHLQKMAQRIRNWPKK